MTKKMVVMGPEMQLRKKKMTRMRQSVKRTRSARTGNLVAVPMDAHIPKGQRNKAALSVLRKCSCATNVRKPCTAVVLIFKTLQQALSLPDVQMRTGSYMRTAPSLNMAAAQMA